MKKLRSFGLTLVTSLALIASGCASLNTGATRSIAKIAAKDATYFSLLEHPEWRPKFELAYVEIDALAQAEQIDVAALAAIVRRLPAKELKSPTAQIIISDVQIVVEELLPNSGVVISRERYTDARQVIDAIRGGMRLGLDMAASPPLSLTGEVKK